MFVVRNAFSKLLAGAILLMAGATAAQAQEYSSEEVAAFANALTEVQGIQQEMKGELQQAEDKQEQAAIQKQAQQDMVQVIEDEGLTVEEYQEMGQAVRENDDFWKRVQKHIAN